MPGTLGEWTLSIALHNGFRIAEVKPPGLKWGIRNSEPADPSFSCELPLGMLQTNGATLKRDSIVPYHHDYWLYRGPHIRASGRITDINLNKDRDTVLVRGMDWLDYLRSRIYPFSPDAYVDDYDWASWPKQWGTGVSTGVDIRNIVEDILVAMIEGRDPQLPNSTSSRVADSDTGNPLNGPALTPPFILANPLSGLQGRYKILPGDETSIFDHIRKLADNSTGFEFDILPHNLEFKMYIPDRDQRIPVYTFTKAMQVEDLDWTNEGPLATVTTILGSGSGPRTGVIRTHLPSAKRYRWTDRAASVGDISSRDMLEKAAQGEQFEDRFPRKRATITITDPEQLTPNFWTGGRPRSLIGNRIGIIHDFGFHKVNAHYKVMALLFDIDRNGNERVDFELQMINTPDANPDFGGGGGGFEAA